MTKKNRPAGARKQGARPVSKPRRNPSSAPAETSLRELWLAGLGAVAETRESARELVDLLVEKGKETEPRLEASARRAFALAREGAAQTTGELTERARIVLDGARERLGIDARPRRKNVLHRLGDLAEAIF
jgi:polyhydroxyalkanoate synthesis regulator phasin